MTEEAVIEGNLHLDLGRGDNVVAMSGLVDGNFHVTGGADDDSLLIDGEVGGNVKIDAGGGKNALEVSGAVGGNLNFTSSTKSDNSRIDIAEDAVAGKTNIRAGNSNSNSNGQNALHKLQRPT